MILLYEEQGEGNKKIKKKGRTEDWKKEGRRNEKSYTEEMRDRREGQEKG